MKAAALLAFLVVPAPADANFQRRLSPLLEAFTLEADKLTFRGVCNGTKQYWGACKTPAAHQKKLRAWMKEVRQAFRSGAGQCARLTQLKNKGRRLRGFVCESEHNPESGVVYSLTTELRCIDHNCMLRLTKGHDDGEQIHLYRFRAKVHSGPTHIRPVAHFWLESKG